MIERSLVVIERHPHSLRGASLLDTDALTGLMAIPGVLDPRVEEFMGERVRCSYLWSGLEPFDRTDEHLYLYGLRRVWEASDES